MENIKNYGNQMKDLDKLINTISSNTSSNMLNEVENTVNNTNSLQVLEYESERVLMTKQLATYYGSTENNLKNNFKNNKDRFRNGKDYFVLKGNELKKFKRKVNNIDLAENSKVTNSHLIPKNINTLYLWTEMGALRHSKILDTNEAWEQFQVLEDCYFQVKDGHVSKQEQNDNHDIDQNVYLNKLIKVFTEALNNFSSVIVQNNAMIARVENKLNQLHNYKPTIEQTSTNKLHSPQDAFNNLFTKPILENGGETKEVKLKDGKVATILVEKHPIDKAIEQLSKQLNDNSLYKTVTCRKIYQEMNKYNLDWNYHKRRYRKRHNINSRKTAITKLNVIKENKKLTDIFNVAVNHLLNKEVS